MALATRGLFERFLSGLRTPTLFKIAAAVFLFDLAVPDVIPVVDEMLFGILTLLAARRKPSGETSSAKSPSA